MSEVEELESRIRSLPPESLAQLREWFYEFDEELWDRQIEADLKAGKFDKVTNGHTQISPKARCANFEALENSTRPLNARVIIAGRRIRRDDHA
jgi:hypothetical protein